MTNHETLTILKDCGFRVHVKHYRFTQDFTGLWARHELFEEKPVPKGGLTTVTIYCPTGTVIHGEARCSRKDTFNKRLGVTIALGRALKSGNIEVYPPATQPSMLQ